MFLTFFVLGVLAIIEPKIIGAPDRLVVLWLFIGASVTAYLLHVTHTWISILKMLTQSNVPKQIQQIHGALTDNARPIPRQIEQIHGALIKSDQPKLDAIKEDIATLSQKVDAIGTLLKIEDVHAKLEGVADALAANGPMRTTLDSIKTRLDAIAPKPTT